MYVGAYVMRTDWFSRSGKRRRNVRKSTLEQTEGSSNLIPKLHQEHQDGFVPRKLVAAMPCCFSLVSGWYSEMSFF